MTKDDIAAIMKYYLVCLVEPDGRGAAEEVGLTQLIPERCPRCGSDRPCKPNRVRGLSHYTCRDAWHMPASALPQEPRTSRAAMVSELVEAGIITAEQAVAIPVVEL